MIKLYIRKSIPIEAVQFIGTFSSKEEVLNFVGAIYSSDANEKLKTCNWIKIKTIDGIRTVNKNDYIMKGFNKEFYIWTESAFNESYKCCRVVVNKI